MADNQSRVATDVVPFQRLAIDSPWGNVDVERGEHVATSTPEIGPLPATRCAVTPGEIQTTTNANRWFPSTGFRAKRLFEFELSIGGASFVFTPFFIRPGRIV